MKVLAQAWHPLPKHRQVIKQKRKAVLQTKSSVKHHQNTHKQDPAYQWKLKCNEIVTSQSMSFSYKQALY